MTNKALDIEKVAKRFKALADSNRIQIVTLLQEGEHCACELLEHLHISQPTLSHHMKLLEETEVVSVVKKGQWRYYQLTSAFQNDFASILQGLNQTDKE